MPQLSVWQSLGTDGKTTGARDLQSVLYFDDSFRHLAQSTLQITAIGSPKVRSSEELKRTWKFLPRFEYADRRAGTQNQCGATAALRLRTLSKERGSTQISLLTNGQTEGEGKILTFSTFVAFLFNVVSKTGS